MQFPYQVRLALLVVFLAIVVGSLYTLYCKSVSGRAEVLLLDQAGTDQFAIDQSNDNKSESGQSGNNRSASGGKVYVHIAGAVKKPGVYTFKSGTRIFQALKTAGGASSSADLEGLNLAAVLEDGVKLEIPVKGQMPRHALGYSSTKEGTEGSFGKTVQSSNKLTTPGQGSININSAGADELTRLPGIGPSTAAKIIEYRGSTGRFSSPEQLMEVKGIGTKKFSKMQPFIRCQ